MQRDFAFHACLGPDVSQTDVMALCGVPQLLDAALAGYNVTIFAYGQTGKPDAGIGTRTHMHTHMHYGFRIGQGGYSGSGKLVHVKSWGLIAPASSDERPTFLAPLDLVCALRQGDKQCCVHRCAVVACGQAPARPTQCQAARR